MMYQYDNYAFAHASPEFGILSLLIHIIVFILGVIVVLWLVRRVLFGRSGAHQWRNRWASHSGLTILNERYAKGEIEKAEYEERKKTLLGQ